MEEWKKEPTHIPSQTRQTRPAIDLACEYYYGHVRYEMSSLPPSVQARTPSTHRFVAVQAPTGFLLHQLYSHTLLLCLLCRSRLPSLRQNYEDEDLPGPKLQDEMNDYLAEVIEDKGIKDLRDTREQVGGVRCN